MRIDIKEAASLLLAQDNILILCHISPDGDTLGSGYALCHALHKLGKNARVHCEDVIPKMYSFIPDGVEVRYFKEDFVVAVDVADEKLLGNSAFREKYADRVDLCIDHHGSNTNYAAKTCLEGNGSAAATAETILLIIKEMGVEPDRDIAECIYVGIATDTGCFRYSNTTSRSMRMAAEMIDVGIDRDSINKLMFDTRTRTYNKLETLALSSLQMHYNGRCAILTITKEMFRQSGSNESESHPIKAIPRQIEGVLVGASMREGEDGWHISVRTNAPASATDICARMGGGGHLRAAGCTVQASLSEAYELLLNSIGEELERIK